VLAAALAQLVPQQQHHAATCMSSPTSRFCLQYLLLQPTLLRSLCHAVLWAQMRLQATMTRLVLLQLLLDLGQAAQLVQGSPADMPMLLQQQIKQLAEAEVSQLPVPGRFRRKMKKMMTTSCVWCAGSSSAVWLWCMEATHTW
jgi:hypothetical protein